MELKELYEIYDDIDKDVDYAFDVAQATVSSQTQELDKLMGDIYTEIISVEEPATSAIEKYFLSLSNCLYFYSERVEKVGLYNDISKSKAKEAYNEAYMDAVNPVDSKKKVTVAEAQTIAEDKTTYENLISTIYARSYKMVSSKISAAQTMLSSLSKMLSKRMQDAQMSVTTRDGTRQYLTEGFNEL